MISNLSFSHFNPLPPHGGRQKSGATRLQYEKFQSTPSAWRETADPAEEIPAENQFQSTPSAWRETCPELSRPEQTRYFNPLPPHGGRRLNRRLSLFSRRISIHSLRMEGDSLISTIPDDETLFQSTPSAWRETLMHTDSDDAGNDFNPLPPHGGRHGLEIADRKVGGISIHSLRMEGDFCQYSA